MTRDKAFIISRALDDIDGFQFFAEEVEKLICDSEEYLILNPDFVEAIKNLLDVEQKRLEKILEDLQGGRK